MHGGHGGIWLKIIFVIMLLIMGWLRAHGM